MLYIPTRFYSYSCVCVYRIIHIGLLGITIDNRLFQAWLYGSGSCTYQEKATMFCGRIPIVIIIILRPIILVYIVLLLCYMQRFHENLTVKIIWSGGMPIDVKAMRMRTTAMR